VPLSSRALQDLSSCALQFSVMSIFKNFYSLLQNMLPQQYRSHLLLGRYLFSCGATVKIGPEPPSFAVSTSHTIWRTHTHTHVQPGITPLYEWSVRHRGGYLHNTQQHKRRTTLPSVEFEPATLQSNSCRYMSQITDHWDPRKVQGANWSETLLPIRLLECNSK